MPQTRFQTYTWDLLVVDISPNEKSTLSECAIYWYDKSDLPFCQKDSPLNTFTLPTMLRREDDNA